MKQTTEDHMFRWMYCGVLVLPLMVGACSPNSTERYEPEDVVPEAQRLFASYVEHGLDEANRSLTQLEEVANDGAAETDTTVDSTVTKLRNEYQQLSEDADSLVEVKDAQYDEKKLALRDRLVDLSRTVERTRLEMFEEPTEFKEAAEMRLTELDKRLYQLRSNVEKADMDAKFDSTLAELDRLREDASQRLIDMVNTVPDEYRNRRGKVTTALTTLTVRLTEAESEYESTAMAGSDVAHRNDKGNLDARSDEFHPTVEPIDENQ